MSTLDRMLVSAAVAASPRSRRAARREQWLADVRDARELDLSPTALAFGALTTALLHRRADRRSSWGNSMTTMPGTVRTTPFTVPAIPVVLGFAVLAFLAASAGLGLLQRYNGYTGAVSAILLVSIALTIVPAIAVAVSVLLATGAPLRRRAIGAVVALAVGALWWSVVTGHLDPLVWPSLTLGAVAAAWLAVWLVVLRRPGWTWPLLLLPVAASALVFPLANSVSGTGLTYSMGAAVATALDLVPFVVGMVAAGIAGRPDLTAPRAGAGPERASSGVIG
ncbi:hypothetical protein [Curtobacterium sp. UCD-KPL2560]|uniref:hypothetical protein n=1 Tax=Curtobacterium sp. UCD-KPL2560 TaxID=1885315 RepID=UPI0008240A2E|nr:hypothetical protein [Curtobacterium sp. UCD-KPL2560]